MANTPALGIAEESPQPDDRRCEDLERKARPLVGNAQIKNRINKSEQEKTI